MTTDVTTRLADICSELAQSNATLYTVLTHDNGSQEYSLLNYLVSKDDYIIDKFYQVFMHPLEEIEYKTFLIAFCRTHAIPLNEQYYEESTHDNTFVQLFNALNHMSHAAKQLENLTRSNPDVRDFLMLPYYSNNNIPIYNPIIEQGIIGKCKAIQGLRKALQCEIKKQIGRYQFDKFMELVPFKP